MIEIRVAGYTNWWSFEVRLNGKWIADSFLYTRRHSAYRGAKRMIKAIQSGNVRYK
jgi:uncharacterized protein YegP (UPF0339 family)